MLKRKPIIYAPKATQALVFQDGEHCKMTEEWCTVDSFPRFLQVTHSLSLIHIGTWDYYPLNKTSEQGEMEHRWRVVEARLSIYKSIHFLIFTYGCKHRVVTEGMRSQVRNEFPSEGVWYHPLGKGEHLIMMPPGRPPMKCTYAGLWNTGETVILTAGMTISSVGCLLAQMSLGWKVLFHYFNAAVVWIGFWVKEKRGEKNLLHHNVHLQ